MVILAVLLHSSIEIARILAETGSTVRTVDRAGGSEEDMAANHTSLTGDP